MRGTGGSASLCRRGPPGKPSTEPDHGAAIAWPRCLLCCAVQESVRAMVPASSLLLVNCVLSQREADDNSGRTLWSVGADLHEQIRSAAKTLEDD